MNVNLFFFTPGNTPLVRINSLSDALGVEILGKAEVSHLLIATQISLLMAEHKVS